jgi:hypothetical protein
VPGAFINSTSVAAAAGVYPVEVVLAPSSDLAATTTADPGTTGTTLALNAAIPGAVAPYCVRVDDEYMYVTAGTTSLTVVRNAKPPSTTSAGAGVAHSIGATVFMMVARERISPVREPMILFDGMVAGFRTLGNAATPQNLFSIECGAAAGNLIVAVKRLAVEMDTTAALTGVAPEFLVTRPAVLPTAGTPMTKSGQDTALTSNANVVVRSAMGGDGVTPTAITASVGPARLWHQFQTRQNAVTSNYLFGPELNLLPTLVEGDPLILRANQGLLVQIIGTAASNAATNHYVCKVAWEEFKTP